jgi:hypothetical protein
VGWRIGSGASQAAMPPAGTRWLGAQVAGAGAGWGAGHVAGAGAGGRPGAGHVAGAGEGGRPGAGHVAGTGWAAISDLIHRIFWRCASTAGSVWESVRLRIMAYSI